MSENFDIKIEKTTFSTRDQVDYNLLDFGKYHTDHMFIVDYNEGKWHNMRIVPFQNISISPATSALHYGQTVFEGFKGHKDLQTEEILIFRPDKHWNRMNKSLERLCMPAIPKEIFMEGTKALANIDRAWAPSREGESLYFRPFAFAMDAFIRVKPSDNYYFIIFCSPVGAYFSGELKVKIEPHYVRAAEGGIGFSKTGGNYAASLLPAKKAAQQGYQQVMWTDSKEHKYVEETGASNIMFVIEGKLVTPALTSSILDGVTRDSIITLAKEIGMEVEERKISIDEILSGIESGKLTEAFGTGTAAVISPISVINYEGKDYSIAAPGPNSFSTTMVAKLNDIKYGKVKDTHNWIIRV